MSGHDAAALLRAVAAGRREYARGMSEDDPRQAADRDLLLQEAAAFEAAARIVEGDFGPLYDLLPTWRWTEAMHARVLSDSSNSTTSADVAALAPLSPPEPPEIPDGELSRIRYYAPGQLGHESPRGVVLKHGPTGLEASSHSERSALQNTLIAYRELRVAEQKAISAAGEPRPVTATGQPRWVDLDADGRRAVRAELDARAAAAAGVDARRSVREESDARVAVSTGKGGLDEDGSAGFDHEVAV